MTPDEELERRMRAVESQIVRLDERVDYATADRDLIRKEIREEAERTRREFRRENQQTRGQIAEVDAECRDFRAEVKRTWEAEQQAKAEKFREEREERQKDRLSRRTLVGALITAIAGVLSTLLLILERLATGT